MTKQAAPTPPKSGPDNKKRLKNAAYIVLIVLLLALAASGAYAKYVYSNSGTDTVLAGEFYFTSDYLSADGEMYTLNPGTTSVTFTLKNHADNLRFSADDIGYTIEVEGDGASVTDPTGTLSKGKNSDIVITLSGLKDGETYTVTATGKAGYSETLSATFIVLSAGAEVYKHLDTSNRAYVVLTVWTENVTGDASIAFPAGLIPDATDPVLDDIKNYSNGTYASESFDDEINKAGEGSFTSPYSSRTYRFFKEDSAESYTVGQFAVSVGGTTAEPSTPK